MHDPRDMAANAGESREPYRMQGDDDPVVAVKNAYAVYIARDCRSPVHGFLQVATRVVGDVNDIYIALMRKYKSEPMAQELHAKLQADCLSFSAGREAEYSKNRMSGAVENEYQISLSFTDRDRLRFEVRGPVDLLYMIPRFGG